MKAFSSQRRVAAIALSGVAHLAVMLLLLDRVGSSPMAPERDSPALEVRLFSPPATRQHRAAPRTVASGKARRPAPASRPSLPTLAAALPLATAPAAPTVPPVPAGLSAALRNSLVGSQMMGFILVDRAVRRHCADRLGTGARGVPKIDGIPADKVAAYDAVAWRQEEDRAYFHLPTVSTLYARDAGGIAGGPASTEIFSHNIGDPSPPKDPLLKRQSRSLGPPVPDR